MSLSYIALFLFTKYWHWTDSTSCLPIWHLCLYVVLLHVHELHFPLPLMRYWHWTDSTSCLPIWNSCLRGLTPRPWVALLSSSLRDIGIELTRHPVSPFDIHVFTWFDSTSLSYISLFLFPKYWRWINLTSCLPQNTIPSCTPFCPHKGSVWRWLVNAGWSHVSE